LERRSREQHNIIKKYTDEKLFPQIDVLTDGNILTILEVNVGFDTAQKKHRFINAPMHQILFRFQIQTLSLNTRHMYIICDLYITTSTNESQRNQWQASLKRFSSFNVTSFKVLLEQ